MRVSGCTECACACVLGGQGGECAWVPAPWPEMKVGSHGKGSRVTRDPLRFLPGEERRGGEGLYQLCWEDDSGKGPYGGLDGERKRRTLLTEM